MKYLANIISLSRPLLAASLFWFINNQKMFIIMYSLCWLTDLIDGPIARATKSQSELGSKLDDLGDTTLIIIMAIILLIWLEFKIISFIPLIIAIVVIRLSNLYITKNKYGKTYIIHTYLAKILGFFVLLLPIVYLISNQIWFIYFVLVFAVITSFEETIIHLSSDKYNPNKKSIFLKR